MAEASRFRMMCRRRHADGTSSDGGDAVATSDGGTPSLPTTAGRRCCRRLFFRRLDHDEFGFLGTDGQR